MRSIWHLLLVWLTVLAMPIQGIAAGGMLHCASEAAQTHAHVHQQDPADEQAKAHADDVVSTSVQAPSVDGVVGEADGAPMHEAEASTTGHTCSACAACCPGAALPVSMIRWPAPDVSFAPMFAPVESSASFIASGLERPPRHPLA